MDRTPELARKYAATFAVVGWGALLCQLYVSLGQAAENGVLIMLGKYFSFFTILTNIMVALTYTAVWRSPSTGFMKTLTGSAWLTAVTVYIFMVCAVANTLLLGLVDFHGLALLADKLLHLVMPVSMLVFWILFAPKSRLKWRYAFIWQAYPAAYIAYVTIIGAFTGFYPYPFANAAKLGYPQALQNGFFIILTFALVSLVFIAISKWKEKSASL